MKKLKDVINKIFILFMILISSFSFVGCSDKKEDLPDVEISSFTYGWVEKEKIDEGGDLTKIGLTTLSPKAYIDYYLVYRFKTTSLEDTEKELKVYSGSDFYYSEKGIMIQKYSDGTLKKFTLNCFDTAKSKFVSVTVPSKAGDYVDTTVAWEFYANRDEMEYNIEIDSTQVELKGNYKNVNKTIKPRKGELEKPSISYDSENNRIVWDTIPNIQYYNVYVNGKLYMEDDYEFVGKQNEAETSYFSLENRGFSGNIKIKIKMYDVGGLANPVSSNTITVTIKG